MSDSEGDVDNEKDTLYDYSLVHFIKRGRKSVTREMDIVPTKWLGFSKKKGRIVTKFPDASSEPEDNLLLHQLVELAADAPADWKEYTVDLKGRAKTYQEALEKFELLKTEENVLTQSDSDGREILKKQMEEDVKRRCLFDAFDQMKNELVPTKVKKPKESTTAACTEDAPDEVDKGNSTVPTKQTGSDNLDQQEASTSTLVHKRSHDSLANTASDSDDDITDQISRKKRTKKTIQSVLNSNPVSEVGQEEPIVIANQQMFASNRASILDVPVIDLSHMTDADFKLAVLTELSFMRKDLQDILQNQEQASNFLIDKEVVKSKATDFHRKYNFVLPIDKNEVFVLFNETLKVNKFMKNDVFGTLKTCIDKNFVLTKSFLSMLRVFITKGVAMKYTATRKSRDKENPKDKMCTLELFKCMQSVILSVRQEKNLETREADLMSALSAVLSNAKAWNETTK